MASWPLVTSKTYLWIHVLTQGDAIRIATQFLNQAMELQASLGSLVLNGKGPGLQ